MREGRIYKVAPSTADDFSRRMMNPGERREEAARGCYLTIRRIDGARMIVSAAPLWRDTDEWAGNRWQLAEAAGRRLEREIYRARPWPTMKGVR